MKKYEMQLETKAKLLLLFTHVTNSKTTTCSPIHIE